MSSLPADKENTASHPLRHAIEELRLADKAYRAMIGVGDFGEYDHNWREFLRRIERVWVKVEAAAHAHPRWQKMQGRFVRLRKSDPLLVYIQQARNVDEHGIQEIARDWDPQLRVERQDGKVELHWKPWDRPLLPVVNRGRTYPPPRIHLGRSIEGLLGKGKSEPRVVGELAMRFYVEMVNEVTEKVFKSAKR